MISVMSPTRRYEKAKNKIQPLIKGSSLLPRASIIKEPNPGQSKILSVMIAPVTSVPN